MHYELSVSTTGVREVTDLTAQVADLVSRAGVDDGASSQGSASISARGARTLRIDSSQSCTDGVKRTVGVVIAVGVNTAVLVPVAVRV
jgi:hypothetical protein